VPEIVYPLAITSAKTSFALLGMKLDVKGSEHLPRTGGAVVASNHTSFLDFVFVGIPADEAGGRWVRFMAKDGVFKNPVSGPLMRNMKHIAVDRQAGSDAYKQALRALRDGELIGVFPEATMSRSMELKDFKTGAARMAAATGTPLVPVIVFGTARLLSYGQKHLSRRVAISIRVGEPLRPGKRDDPDAVTAQLHDRMAALLDEVLAEYPQQPRDGSKAWWWPARLGGAAPTLHEAETIEREVKAAKAARRAHG
jgi:1-acyl-sn-glycerol-3-phosphate acyltransferase